MSAPKVAVELLFKQAVRTLVTATLYFAGASQLVGGEKPTSLGKLEKLTNLK
jgi:hypothetical protein